jgi:5-methyltetrahydropteroyltriglutamate--homocysteine methyltransferase
MRYAHVPVKQAVISFSARSLMYPAEEISSYSRDEFLDDLLKEHETEVRRCLQRGAHCVQIDFTEGRLAVKLDPSGQLLTSFIDFEQPRAVAVLSGGTQPHRRTYLSRQRLRLHPQRRRRLRGVGAPALMQLRVRNFYFALANEADPVRVLKIIRNNMKPDHRIFIGVVDPTDPRIETPEEIRDRVLVAAKFIPIEQLGTTDDCGFSPFSDDTSTTGDTAFAKIKARVRGTALASEIIGGR